MRVFAGSCRRQPNGRTLFTAPAREFCSRAGATDLADGIRQENEIAVALSGCGRDLRKDAVGLDFRRLD